MKPMPGFSLYDRSQIVLSFCEDGTELLHSREKDILLYPLQHCRGFRMPVSHYAKNNGSET